MESKKYADVMAAAISQPPLNEQELSLFNRLLDMSPELCKPHQREDDLGYEWGCAMLGALTVATARRVTSGWMTAEQAVDSWAKHPNCGECPLDSAKSGK